MEKHELSHDAGAVSWRWWAAAGLMALGAAVTVSAWADIVHIAMTDEEASQVWLVPVIVVWLVWARRGHAAGMRLRSSWVGPLAIAAGWAFSTWGFNYDVEVFWQFGAVLTVVGCLVTVVGLEVVKRFWPAFLVLGFLVPIPGILRVQIALPLQYAAASSAGFILNLMGASVQQSGSVLIYHGHEVLVAEACNGMRMVFSLILVSCAFAFATPLRTVVRLLVIALSPAAALVCNVIRLVPTVWVYGHYPQGVATMFHDVTGWAMLVVAFLLLMGVIRLLQWAQIPVMQEEAVEAPPSSRSMEGSLA